MIEKTVDELASRVKELEQHMAIVDETITYMLKEIHKPALRALTADLFAHSKAKDI